MIAIWVLLGVILVAYAYHGCLAMVSAIGYKFWPCKSESILFHRAIRHDDAGVYCKSCGAEWYWQAWGGIASDGHLAYQLERRHD